MSRGVRTRDVPEPVRQALLVYINIKRIYGICITTTCNNVAAPPSTRCARCNDNNLTRAVTHRLKKYREERGE